MRVAALVVVLLAVAASGAPAPIRVLPASETAPRHALWARGAAKSQSQSQSQSQTQSESTLVTATALADWALHAVGGPLLPSSSFAVSYGEETALGSSQNAPFAARKPGSKARAHVLVALTGTTGRLAAEQEQSLLEGGEGVSFGSSLSDVVSSPDPHVALVDDTVALLATVARGVPSTSHGVVAKEWPVQGRHGVAHAFKAGAWPAPEVFPSAADALMHEAFVRFKAASGRDGDNSEAGMPRVVSASADFASAAAFAVHPRWASVASKAQAGSAQAFYIDTKHFLKSVYSTSASAPASSTVTLPTPTTREAILARAAGKESFDPQGNDADFRFFAELELLRMAADSVTAGAGELKEPAMLFFTFSTIQSLDASKRVEARSMAVAATKQALAQIDAAFGDVDAKVLFADTERSIEPLLASDKALVGDIFKTVMQDTSREYFSRFYPVFFADASGDSQHLCNELKAFISTKPQYRVACALVEDEVRQASYPAIHRSLEPRATPRGVAGAELGSSTENAGGNNIILWSSIALLFITYAGIYAIYAMEINTDDMIYRLTNIRDKSKTESKGFL